MRDVLLVPRMTSNLIVVSALEDEGYDVIEMVVIDRVMSLHSKV